MILEESVTKDNVPVFKEVIFVPVEYFVALIELSLRKVLVEVWYALIDGCDLDWALVFEMRCPQFLVSCHVSQ